MLPQGQQGPCFAVLQLPCVHALASISDALEGHPDIQQACVVAVPDEIKGEKPFAFVIRRPGSPLTEEDVKQYALANAPAYQHPRQVSFMTEFPLAGTNKVDRKVLGALAREQWRGDKTGDGAR